MPVTNPGVRDGHDLQGALSEASARRCPLAVETYNDTAFGDIFLHLLTGHLTLLSDDFGTEEFCSAVFDNFLLTSFSRYDTFFLKPL